MELKLIALAGAGGFIGSSLRYAVSYLVMLKFGEVFPLGTLAVNIVGSFLLGMLLGLALVKPEQGVATLSMPWKVFLSTGICGGFTTFSAFSAETLYMFENGATSLAILYIVLSVIGGIFAVFMGLMVTR